MTTFREYLDIPLLIRLFEYVMDDIKDDVALHKFIEKLMAAGLGKTLTMSDYARIVQR